MAASLHSLSGVTDLLSTASVVGFSGSRTPTASSLRAVRWALGQLSPSSTVVAGCARGVDATVRAGLPASRLRIFEAASFGQGRGAFAARSIACVRAVAAADTALWVAFPSGPCPGGLLPSSSPSACFSGFGSGTWASLAFAIGSGLRCLLFLPPMMSAPAGWLLVNVVGTRSWWQYSPMSIQGHLFRHNASAPI